MSDQTDPPKTPTETPGIFPETPQTPLTPARRRATSIRTRGELPPAPTKEEGEQPEIPTKQPLPEPSDNLEDEYNISGLPSFKKYRDIYNLNKEPAKEQYIKLRDFIRQ